MRILLTFLAAALLTEVHSILRLSAKVEQVERREDPTIDEIAAEAAQAQADIAKAQKEAAEALQKGPAAEKKDEKPKRKKMDPIENMRIMMCWGRKNLMEHEKCMEWMVKKCKKETSGDGYCKKLRRYIKSKCKKGNAQACDYAKKLGIDIATDKEQTDPEDEDGDGVKDKDDAFPDNPMEWKDSDGDGVGDNNDKWPNDPTCADEGDVCGGPAPGPAPAMAPAPAAPIGLTMDESVPLPSQGYNEHSTKYVAHDDGKTMTRDWRSEWPRSQGDEESSIKAICDKNPRLAWCKLKLSKAHRQAYADSHP